MVSKIQALSNMPNSSDPMKPEFFRRLDESDDAEFYRSPRRVVHIDDSAIEVVRQIYASYLKPHTAILDLMSSWRSHLPEGLAATSVTGLGLNREEMLDNPAMTEIVIHDINREPRLPFLDSSFDAAVMAVSVQYLIHPIETFAEVGRVLRPGGPFIVTFSNRMFPTKAVALWQGMRESDRVRIVASYFTQSRAFDQVEVLDRSRRDPPGDPIWAVVGSAKSDDSGDRP
jgi:SAM-dependent methyltransferase